LHIRRHGITVTTPSLSTEKATLKAEVAAVNDYAEGTECECTAVLRAPSGAAVAETTGRRSIPGRSCAVVELDTIEVPDPALWSVDEPNCYLLEVQLKQAGTAVDADSTVVGFRWFEFTADRGFFLNGKRVKLRGLNRHQDYPGLGNAVPPRLQVRDAKILSEMGANFVRLSHYPQHPAFLDACDRLGILVYEEIASWQYIGGEMFARNAECMLREMIARDKNHPSIILWGLLNEGRSKPLFERLHRVAKECDPTRRTIYAENNPAEGKERGTVFVPDVLGLNYKLPHLDEIRADLPGRRFLSAETTNYEHRRRGDVEQDIGQVKRFKADTDLVEEREYMAGMALWSMHDYATDYELSWPIQPSGVLDGYRLPKGGYWFLRSRWSSIPVVRIVGHWNWPGRKGERVPVLVCSNADSVELFLNGKSLGAKSDRLLAQWDVPYAPGALRAVARCGNTTIEHGLRTAGDPAALLIDSSDEVLLADGADVAEITITVVDRDRNPVLTEEGHAVFRVEGPATIRGIAGIPCTPVLGGTGRTVVQAKTVPGTVVVYAAYRGLPETAVTLRTELAASSGL
jgi:beta-galactosidase